MELEKFLQAMEIPYHDIEIFKQAFTPVSYTHLDVYKRQLENLEKKLKLILKSRNI